MADRVYLAGEWHERGDNWRDQVDLGTCDAMTAYAAGRLDGHRHAMSEFKAMWDLLLTLDATWNTDDVRAALEVSNAKPKFIATPPHRGHLRVVRA